MQYVGIIVAEAICHYNRYGYRQTMAEWVQEYQRKNLALFPSANG
jgi:hypothetical protein